LDGLGWLAVLSPFRWTANHIALVGEFDWAGVALVGVVAAVFLAIGVALAAEVAAVVVVLTHLVDLLAPAFKLPDWVHQLALTAHMGQPMVGDWDPTGIVLSVALAVGGTLIGAWGMGRRDVAR